ncbi:MAG: GMC family oxidoreductase N-terminal domain-containing protein [Pseudomonadota bacterium]
MADGQHNRLIDEPVDVLVVGAGSAGCVVASRVSEDSNKHVVLVEAGPDYPDLAATPFDLINSHNNSYTAHDWGFNYQPTSTRSDRFPRGRVVGGSSSVNTTIALRGMPEDYDEWADAGNPGWTWPEVLPAFKRLERDLDFPNADYHGDSGPISIRRYPTEELLPQHQAFLESAAALGYPHCADANDPEGWGAGPHPMNKLGRVRVSAAVGYLAPARIRPNLTICADTTVYRVIVERGKCTGVEVERHGERFVIHARLVVLSAGALMTPSLLLRSGIGAAAEISRLGVDLVQDVPGVGENLSDHPALSVVCQVKDSSLIDFDAPIIQTILRYTAPGSDKRNDLQIEQISFAGRPGGPPLFVIAPVLEYQHGRGRLSLADANPATHPTIENRFCENDLDCERLAGCVQDTLAFTQVGPLAEMIESVTFPDPARGTELDDIKSLCRKFSGSGYHPCGTAKMGPVEDPMAVVDAKGRCHTVSQLVVADASIMPSVPRANTNLSCLMIGEKIGEWIRTQPADYGL